MPMVCVLHSNRVQLCQEGEASQWQAEQSIHTQVEAHLHTYPLSAEQTGFTATLPGKGGRDCRKRGKQTIGRQQSEQGTVRLVFAFLMLLWLGQWRRRLDTGVVLSVLPLIQHVASVKVRHFSVPQFSPSVNWI